MFDQSPKQSIDMGGGDSPLEKVDNTPTPMSEALPKPKPTLPKPPNALSSFPPEKKYGDVEDIFADIEKKQDVKEEKKIESKSAGGVKSTKTPVVAYAAFGGLALIVLVGGAWLIVSTLMPGGEKVTMIEDVVVDMPGEIVEEGEVEVAEELMQVEDVSEGVDVATATPGARLGETTDMQEATSTGRDDLDKEDEMVTGAPVIMRDTDSDGLTDSEEADLGTNPILVDSDSDQLTDYEEANVYFTDPMAIDTDEDGLSDYSEASVYFTDPNNMDTDGDSYFDGEEVENGYNPLGEGKLETS